MTAMTQQIGISDSTAANLAQLQALGDFASAEEMIDAMVARELERFEELKAAVREGAEAIERGHYTEYTSAEEMVADVMREAREQFARERGRH